MLDTIAMERRGIPAAIIGAEKLVTTTGRGMARAQGFPDLDMAVLVQPQGIMTSGSDDAAQIADLVSQAVPQVERILLGASPAEGAGGER